MSFMTTPCGGPALHGANGVRIEPSGLRTPRVFSMASINAYICRVVRVGPSSRFGLSFCLISINNFHLSSYDGHVRSQCMRLKQHLVWTTDCILS